MYTLVAVFVAARIIDFIQEGAYTAKGAIIISNKSDEIAEIIIKDINRGVTVLKGKGSFTGEKRNVLYCVVSKNETNRMKNIINRIDPYAFVAITSVHDVSGEGFTLDENKNPINTYNRMITCDHPVFRKPHSLLAAYIKMKRSNSITATRAAATYVKAAAFNTFFVPRSSSLRMIPDDTSCVIARLEALNSTGNVTSWNKTAAAMKIIPI